MNPETQRIEKHQGGGFAVFGLGGPRCAPGPSEKRLWMNSQSRRMGRDFCGLRVESITTADLWEWRG
eukprot:9215233-Pyramimonas_sp.AAC.1